jgi:hypothetical protein
MGGWSYRLPTGIGQPGSTLKLRQATAAVEFVVVSHRPFDGSTRKSSIQQDVGVRIFGWRIVRGGQTRYDKASGEDNGQHFVEIGTIEKPHLSCPGGRNMEKAQILEQNLKAPRTERCATVMSLLFNPKIPATRARDTHQTRCDAS